MNANSGLQLQKVTPVSPYWEIQVVDENDPKEWLHMNTVR